MPIDILLGILCFLALVTIILIIIFRPRRNDYTNIIKEKIDGLQSNLKEDFKFNREENSTIARENRVELSSTLKDFRYEMGIALNKITQQNSDALVLINKTLEDRIKGLVSKIEDGNKENRNTLTTNLKDFTFEQKTKFDDLKAELRSLADKTGLELEKITVKVEEKLSGLDEQAKINAKETRDELSSSIKDFQETFKQSLSEFNVLQREKFGELEQRQEKLIGSTEKKLEEMRVTVEEKLQKTLSERLGQSFEQVGKQLENVQKGLGEMQTLAQDVGGLKKVLSNVRMRGGFGEVQLSMLLEQILAPEQYATNIKTKHNSSDSVEFAIKLPGQGEINEHLWLPIDAKFPKDVYEQLQAAYETGDPTAIEIAQRNLDTTVKRMAKDIRDKYLDPPNTTDFGIMFLPFEGIYAEVVRKASLLEELLRNYKVVVTGPTTLAAILNSLQMGFRTLIIQKRSSEVWQILGAVKKEFEIFGGLLDKAQKNLQTASNQIDEVMGKRTRAIQRKLKGVEALSESETKLLLPEIAEGEILDEESDN